MERIVVDLQTGTTTVVPLTQEEIAQAQAQKAAWDAEQAAVVKEPTTAELTAKVQALEARLASDGPSNGGQA